MTSRNESEKRLEVAIEAFRRLLRDSWVAVNQVADDHAEGERSEFLANWMQANWEFLVESHVFWGDKKCTLDPYGDGAETGTPGSRIQGTDTEPTHAVAIRNRGSEPLFDALTGNSISQSDEIVFDRFAASSKDGWFIEAPPFNWAVGYIKEREVLVEVVQADFRLVPKP